MDTHTHTATYRVTRVELYNAPDGQGNTREMARLVLRDVTPGHPGYERQLEVSLDEAFPIGAEVNATESYSLAAKKK